MNEDKILQFEKASEVFAGLRAEGKRIVQCHGTFDLIHPGHIIHLEEAKALGDTLVVTVTAEQFVNKGPGRPHFNDQLRARSLAALGCVDHVVLIPYPAAVEAIECVKPNVYCKGKEYENPESDVTGSIRDDVRTVEKHGGKVRFIGSVVYSSTRLLNQNFAHIDEPIKDYCKEIAKSYTPGKLREIVDDFYDTRVLIIGDIIFDRYSNVTVQGLTSKNRIISGRFLDEETQAGGALAVFRHLKEFCANVRLVSLVGTESFVDTHIRDYIAPEEDGIIRDESFTTIVKQRFVEPTAEGKELGKLFSINIIDSEPPKESTQRAVLERIDHDIKEFDFVLVADFGHGLMQREIRESVQAKAQFLALNCQTNSNNHGFNIISRQYEKADCFSLDQQELQLACGHRHLDYLAELGKLRSQFNAQSAWLTRGAVETLGVQEGEEPAICKPLETVVTDTIGAGDAFFSVASLAAYRNLPVNLSTLLGQLAGAQAVKIVGNSRPISKAVLLKGGMSLLNF